MAVQTATRALIIKVKVEGSSHTWYSASSQWITTTEALRYIVMHVVTNKRLTKQEWFQMSFEGLCDVEGERRTGGRLFHARGPATPNARSPIVERRVDGTTRSADDAERKRRLAVLPTDTVRSVMYLGAAPFRQRWTSTHNLYWTRCGTRSSVADAIQPVYRTLKTGWHMVIEVPMTISQKASRNWRIALQPFKQNFSDISCRSAEFY